MEDHGKIITHFETMFGENIDHEVIKMILQACEWDTNIAYEQILNLIDPSSCQENRNEVTEIDTASSVVKKNASDSSSKDSISVIDQSTSQEVISSKVDFIKKLILENKKILIIMRGLPGSGKSSLAKSLNRNGIVLSTDDYFYDKYKNYNYNPNILPEAHNWNKDRAKFQIYQGVSPIFIDNTNLQLWEFEPYIRSALQNDYYVDILEPKTVWKYDCNMLSKKCIHNIPKKKILEMKERFETFLSIDDILKKLKLTNNVQDIEVDYARTLSRNSDPDIVIEEDSADTSEEDSSSMENVKHNEERYDQKIPDDVFEDIIDNFQKLLIPKNVQHKELSEVTREFAKSSNKIDRAKDEAMYKLCSDIEDKIGKPFFSSRSTDEEKVTCLDEFPDLINTKKDLPSQINNLTMEDWSCITASDIDNLKSWESQSIERGKKNYSSSNSSKPQRIKKSETSLLCNNFLTSSSTSEDTEDEVVIDWDSVTDKSKLSWENNSSELPMGIHGAIPKRLRNPKLTKSSSPHVKFKKDKSTQYQTADYSSSKNNINIIQCNPSAFIPYPLIDIKENEALTKTKLFLDKSTMTSDFADYEKPSNGTCPLKELKSFFPDLSAEDLKDFLEKCDYDIDWTMNLLIDSGYKISSNSSYKSKSQFSDDDSNPDIVDDKSATLIANDKDVKNEKSHLLLNFENDYESSDECSKEEDKYSLSISSNSLSYEDEDSTKEGPQYLTMEIDMRFASQLINLFGPISSIKLSKGYTKEDCKIVLPLELCHDIYKYWSKTLEGKFQHETDILDMFIREDEELARKLQDEENAVEKVTLKENTPSFQEIVEMQKSEVSNAKLKASKDTTCASMLSLQKLQEEFGHVDPTIVEDEYCNQNFDYSSTKTILAYKYGNSKSIPKTVIAPGTILLQKDEDSSDEEEEENFEDFSIAVEDPQMYRDEAQLHYLEGKKALKKAQDADQKGMKSVASYYAQIRNMHMQKFKEANDRASKKILDAVNTGKCPNTLDLHLLHVDEALREAQRFLSERRGVVYNMHLREMQVTIITGKGKHSVNGARLKPAIQMFLKNENYLYSEYSGHFKVTLKSQTRV